MKKNEKMILGNPESNSSSRVRVSEKEMLKASIELKEQETNKKLIELAENLKKVQNSKSTNKQVVVETLSQTINLIAQFKDVILEIKALELAFEAIADTFSIVDDVFQVIDLIMNQQIAQDTGAFSGLRARMNVNKMARSIKRRFSKMQSTFMVIPKMMGIMGGFNNILGKSMGKMSKKNKQSAQRDGREFSGGLTPEAIEMLKEQGVDMEQGEGSGSGASSGGQGGTPSGGQGGSSSGSSDNGGSNPFDGI